MVSPHVIAPCRVFRLVAGLRMMLRNTRSSGPFRFSNVQLTTQFALERIDDALRVAHRVLQTSLTWNAVISWLPSLALCGLLLVHEKLVNSARMGHKSRSNQAALKVSALRINKTNLAGKSKLPHLPRDDAVQLLRPVGQLENNRRRALTPWLSGWHPGITNALSCCLRRLNLQLSGWQFRTTFCLGDSRHRVIVLPQ